ncbi:hypothetical protein F5X99DRAFT_330494 [Biscogniauxia marginata]|nr:hypothetical protein F5X99DRAFT_330494 [Biscogniauxia marginata]
MTRTLLSFLFVTVPSLWIQIAFCVSIPHGLRNSFAIRQDNITTVMTNVTSDHQPVSVDIHITQAISYFKNALEAEGMTYDGDIGTAATRLVRYDGCDNWDGNEIYKGWLQSWKIMNQILEEADNINWNEASAVEYLGPPALNVGVQTRIKDLYKKWATIQPGYIPTPFDWRLHVRCDDPRRKCKNACDPNPANRGPYAYTTNKDADSGLARINFCPRYFQTLNLNDAIDNGNDPGMGPEWQYDVGSYMMNKGHVWAHELMHVDWTVNAESYGDNRHISDLRMTARGVGGHSITVKAYGPQPVKALARYAVDTGEWVMRNADSLALYASVRYIQSRLGNIYPHLPLAPAAPSSVWDPNNRDSDSVETRSSDNASLAAWDLYGNGSVALPAVNNFYSYSHDPKCPTAYSASNGTAPGDDVHDEDAEDNPDYTFNFDTFASADDLGEDYSDQLNDWWRDLYQESGGVCVVPSGCYNAVPSGCAVVCA